MRASHPVPVELTPQLTWVSPSDTGHFTPAQDIDIAVEPIPVGGTMGCIYLDARDDNLNIRLIKRYASDDTVSHALYFTRPVGYAIEIFLKDKDSDDDRTISPSSSNLTEPHEYTIHGGLDQYSAIVVRTLGENYTFFDRQAIVVSDGIQLIDHVDDIPVIGPPLLPQSSDASPQGEVRDALTMGTGGGDSLNDRVSAISVSDVTPDGHPGVVSSQRR